MSNQARKQQCFMHLAKYHFEDLRRAGLMPDIPEIPPVIADILSTRLSDVCDEHGWCLIDLHVYTDRIEALLTGIELAGETGEEVAAALDGAVYGAMSPRTEATN